MTKEEGIKKVKDFKDQMAIYDDILDFLEFLQARRESIKDSGINLTIDMKKDSFREKRNGICYYANVSKLL